MISLEEFSGVIESTEEACGSFGFAEEGDGFFEKKDINEACFIFLTSTAIFDFSFGLMAIEIYWRLKKKKIKSMELEVGKKR